MAGLEALAGRPTPKNNGKGQLPPQENVAAQVLEYHIQKVGQQNPESDTMKVKLLNAAFGFDAGAEVTVKMRGEASENRREIGELPRKWGMASRVKEQGGVELQKAYYDKKEGAIRPLYMSVLKPESQSQRHLVMTGVPTKVFPERERNGYKEQNVQFLVPNKAQQFTTFEEFEQLADKYLQEDPREKGFYGWDVGFYVTAVLESDDAAHGVEAVSEMCTQRVHANRPIAWSAEKGRYVRDDQNGELPRPDLEEGAIYVAPTREVLDRWYNAQDNEGNPGPGGRFHAALSNYGDQASFYFIPFYQLELMKNIKASGANAKMDLSNLCNDPRINRVGFTQANLVVQRVGEDDDTTAPYYVSHMNPRVAWGKNPVMQAHEVPHDKMPQSALDKIETRRTTEVEEVVAQRQNTNGGQGQTNGQAAQENDDDDDFSRGLSNEDNQNETAATASPGM